jgi:hypothetical protein
MSPAPIDRILDAEALADEAVERCIEAEKIEDERERRVEIERIRREFKDRWLERKRGRSG